MLTTGICTITEVHLCSFIIVKGYIHLIFFAESRWEDTMVLYIKLVSLKDNIFILIFAKFLVRKHN